MASAASWASIVRLGNATSSRCVARMKRPVALQWGQRPRQPRCRRPRRQRWRRANRTRGIVPCIRGALRWDTTSDGASTITTIREIMATARVFSLIVLFASGSICRILTFSPFLYVADGDYGSHDYSYIAAPPAHTVPPPTPVPTAFPSKRPTAFPTQRPTRASASPTTAKPTAAATTDDVAVDGNAFYAFGLGALLRSLWHRFIFLSPKPDDPLQYQ